MECDKEFDEEWKMSAHTKMHKRYKCDQCEKTFKFPDIRTKHIQVKHQNAKYYCHFFNNRKTCPYDDECVFLHEHSKLCKYGDECERTYCMFQHEDNDVIEKENVNEGKKLNKKENLNDKKSVNEEENVYEEEHVNEENLSKIINVDENDESGDQDNIITNSTFINPSQFEQSTSGIFFKCEICDFISARKTYITART